MEIVNIIGHDNLIRDLDSKAILTTDSGALERYKRQTKIFQDAKEKMEAIDILKRDIDEIKIIMAAILAKLKD